MPKAASRTGAARAVKLVERRGQQLVAGRRDRQRTTGGSRGRRASASPYRSAGPSRPIATAAGRHRSRRSASGVERRRGRRRRPATGRRPTVDPAGRQVLAGGDAAERVALGRARHGERPPRRARAMPAKVRVIRSWGFTPVRVAVGHHQVVGVDVAAPADPGNSEAVWPSGPRPRWTRSRSGECGHQLPGRRRPPRPAGPARTSGGRSRPGRRRRAGSRRSSGGWSRGRRAGRTARRPGRRRRRDQSSPASGGQRPVALLGRRRPRTGTSE